jgi:multidrug efflux pump subunit AcrB
MKNCKLSWILVGVLLVIVAMFAYKFTVGEVAPSEDGRMAVILNKNEHNALMKEMRNWLQSSQSILAAATANDFDTVSKVATAAGMIAEADVPGPLFRKIPLEMKALGFDTRKKFDQIAADAVKLKDSNHTVHN